MVTVTERWEAEVLGECARCGGEMTIAPHVMGIELGPGRYLCHPCYFYRFNGSRAQATEALGLEPSGDDDPTPGPAAPAARSTLWVLMAGQAAPRELTPDEEAELAEFSEACRASAPLPEPCVQCGRPASPYEETPDGPLCWKCWPPARVAPGDVPQPRLALAAC
jgi:hypothetical protein